MLLTDSMGRALFEYPNSLKVVTAIVEPSLDSALPDKKLQLERHGYFVANRIDHVKGKKSEHDLAMVLKDSWGM